jgi:hypothetical protein
VADVVLHGVQDGLVLKDPDGVVTQCVNEHLWAAPSASARSVGLDMSFCNDCKMVSQVIPVCPRVFA